MMCNQKEYNAYEDKSYHDWINNNVPFVHQWKHMIHVMEKIYKDGFAAGFAQRDKVDSAEQLQK